MSSSEENSSDDDQTGFSSNTAPPSDLKDNQKRWLVIGICLHDILSPVLRKYIESEINQLYTSLVTSNNINAQLYNNGFLERYPPSSNGYRLNYETINNNKAFYKGQVKLYDYKVQNAVDFSKLFLQQLTIAHYTDFDEACDSSALLAILINVDTFPTVVQHDANSIRSKIKNPWAHCDFSQWDTGRNVYCIQLMINLVKKLSLILSEENRIIGDLNRWGTTGKTFKALKSADENLHERMTQIEDEQRRLIENNTCQDEETIPKNIQEENEKAFKSTGKNAHERMAKIEDEHRRIKIDVERQEDETIPKNIRDDICGKNSISINTVQLWKDLNDRIEKLFKTDDENNAANLSRSRGVKRKILLISCKNHIYRNVHFQEVNLFTKFECNLLSYELCLLPTEKELMFERYISADMIYSLPHLAEYSDLFPLLCQISKGKDRKELEKFFSSPIDYIKGDIDNLLSSDNNMQACAVVLCILFGDSFYIEWFEKNTVSARVAQKIRKACEKGNINVVKLLIRNKAYIHQLTIYGESSIFVACKEGHVDVVKLLLVHKANIFHRTISGWNPLHAAVSQGRTAVVEMILTKCPLCIVDCARSGPSLIYLAYTGGYYDIAKLLENYDRVSKVFQRLYFGMGT
ncbi:Hypothetical predicted protein [Mytilus galloprovincialis]|uniref:Uncharacterized protein n=1 Tax=Mytilus galloprovincialis TaxID=29158 RepID=A0A8B6GG21_MYTGA|nr:Hypothetical predicted protein [Mytilus galloprovincialis]